MDSAQFRLMAQTQQESGFSTPTVCETVNFTVHLEILVMDNINYSLIVQNPDYCSKGITH